MRLSATLTARLFNLLVMRVVAVRQPDFIVGAGTPEGPYLQRWFLTPWRTWQNALGKRAEANQTRWNVLAERVARLLPNVYLHCFLRDDDDRALHDHPSWGASLILSGGYLEHTIAAGGVHRRVEHRPGTFRFMGVRHAHRIELFRQVVADGGPAVRLSDPVVPCFTLFMFGPAVREWGFHCPQRGWVHWREFTAQGQPGEIGPGCDA